MTTDATTNEAAAAATDETVAATEGAATEGVVTGTEAAAAAGTETAPTHTRPEGLDDKFWDDATGLKVGDLVSELREMQAEKAARTEGVPKEGEAYDLALPADFTPPEGYSVEIKADDPLWADFQTIAREAGLPKADFGKFVGAFARYQIAAQQADVEAFVAEKSALGANADTRIRAAETYLAANLPTKQAEALGRALLSADGVQGLEALIKLKSGPVAASGVNTPAVTDRKFGDGWFQSMPAKKTA